LALQIVGDIPRSQELLILQMLTERIALGVCMEQAALLRHRLHEQPGLSLRRLILQPEPALKQRREDLTHQPGFVHDYRRPLFPVAFARSLPVDIIGRVRQ